MTNLAEFICNNILILSLILLVWGVGVLVAGFVIYRKKKKRQQQNGIYEK